MLRDENIFWGITEYLIEKGADIFLICIAPGWVSWKRSNQNIILLPTIFTSLYLYSSVFFLYIYVK